MKTILALILMTGSAFAADVTAVEMERLCQAHYAEGCLYTLTSIRRQDVIKDFGEIIAQYKDVGDDDLKNACIEYGGDGGPCLAYYSRTGAIIKKEKPNLGTENTFN